VSTRRTRSPAVSVEGSVKDPPGAGQTPGETLGDSDVDDDAEQLSPEAQMALVVAPGGSDGDPGDAPKPPLPPPGSDNVSGDAPKPPLPPPGSADVPGDEGDADKYFCFWRILAAFLRSVRVSVRFSVARCVPARGSVFELGERLLSPLKRAARESWCIRAAVANHGLVIRFDSPQNYFCENSFPDESISKFPARTRAPRMFSW